MKKTGFLGLPVQIQELVTDGLDAEITMAQERIREAEGARPRDPELVGSLKGDIVQSKALRDRLTGGQA